MQISEKLVGEDGVFRSVFTTYAFNTDPHFQASLAFYFGMIQDLAGIHGACYGVSIPELQRMGMTWMILRTRLFVDRYACWPETLTGETWICPPRGLHWLRAFRALDEQGKAVFHGESQWVLLDTAKGRPLRPSDCPAAIPAAKADDPVHVVTGDFPRHVFDKNPEEILVREGTPRVHLADCDGNHHVSNLADIRWLSQDLPHAFLLSHKVKAIDTTWEKQLFYGDEIKVRTFALSPDPFGEKEPKLIHRIVRLNKDGSEEEAFCAISEWGDGKTLAPPSRYTSL